MVQHAAAGYLKGITDSPSLALKLYGSSDLTAGSQAAVRRFVEALEGEVRAETP